MFHVEQLIRIQGGAGGNPRPCSFRPLAVADRPHSPPRIVTRKGWLLYSNARLRSYHLTIICATDTANKVSVCLAVNFV